MTAVNNSTLMALPTELRFAIFALLVMSAVPLELVFGIDMSVLTALSATSKSIRKEVLELFFKENTFFIADFDRSEPVLLKAPTSFIARIRWLKIEYVLKQDDEEQYHDSIDPDLMKTVAMMKRLKGCTVVLHQCRHECYWVKELHSNIMWDSDCSLGKYNGREKEEFFQGLHMSKACDLTLLVADIHGEVRTVNETIAKAAHDSHQRYGMDWSHFLAIKDRKGDTW